ncbi:MAG: hypothetical protein ACPGR8_17440, partial [Limisphaerales bacterium]
AHALTAGTRDRKRKSNVKIDSVDDAVVIRNGQLPDEDPNFDATGVYPARHIGEKHKERFQKRLRRDLEEGTVSSVAEYKADLSGTFDAAEAAGAAD